MFTTVTALCLRRQEVRFLQQTKRMGHTHHTCAYVGRYHGYAIGLFQLQCLDANCSVDLSLEGSTLVQLLQPSQNPQPTDSHPETPEGFVDTSFREHNCSCSEFPQPL